MGFTEMLFVAGLALILIGPKQLPELARNLGRILNELKRSTSIFTEELKAQTDFDRQIRKPLLHEDVEKSKDSVTVENKPADEKPS